MSVKILYDVQGGDALERAPDTISTSTWTADNGVTVDSDSKTGSTTTVWVSGGTAGKYATLLNRVTTTAGRTHDRTIVLELRER